MPRCASLSSEQLLEQTGKPEILICPHTSQEYLGSFAQLTFGSFSTMSIPGLGQLPIKVSGHIQSAKAIHTHHVCAQATTDHIKKTITLHPYWEWRFKVSHENHITLRLLSGSAERDGTELALNKSYRFSGARSKITTLQGCLLEVEGSPQHDHVAEGHPATSLTTAHLNLHFLLANLRQDAARGSQGGTGPRLMVVGPASTGKTTLARELTAWGVKQGAQPLVVNTDPREGMLSLPGTLTAATFATMMDVEAEGGWGGTPMSGPSAVPVKLPIIFQFGRQYATDDVHLYKEAVSKLAGAVTERMSDNAEARTSGLIIDTPGITLEGKLGQEEMGLLAHIVEEFSVNMILVIGSKSIEKAVMDRFSGEKTTLGDATCVTALEKASGVVQNDEAWVLASQQAAIKEYFFGDYKTTLNPSKQLLDLDAITIYRMPDRKYSVPLSFNALSCQADTNGTPTAAEGPPEHRGLNKVDPSPALSHWTMPIMNATIGDAPEAIRTAAVQGFVYIADVDKDRRKINVLFPTSGRDARKPLLLGAWPEPFVNLLG